MLLNKGVTGFLDKPSAVRLDEDTRVNEFKKHCYSYILLGGGEVLNFFEPTIEINYAHAQLNFSGEVFYVFFHNVYDYIACSKNKVITALEFIDYEKIQLHFQEKYKVLTKSELNEVLVCRQSKQKGLYLLNDNDLDQAELKYMKYFGAEVVGDLIFNYWD